MRASFIRTAVAVGLAAVSAWLIGVVQGNAVTVAGAIEQDYGGKDYGIGSAK